MSGNAAADSVEEPEPDAELDLEIEVETLLRERLQHSAQLVQFSCDKSSGRIVLTGRLGSFYHKQLAQEAVRQVARVVEIVNDIDVTRDTVI